MSDHHDDWSAVAMAFACALLLFACVAVLFVPTVISVLWSIELP